MVRNLLAFLFLGGSLLAAGLVAPLIDTPPTLDGNIDPTEWRQATQIDGFGSDRRRATAYVTATRERLYLAVRSQLPVKGQLMTAVHEDLPRMVFDDSIEVWIDPDSEAGKGVVYQLMTNPNGGRWSTGHKRGGFDLAQDWAAAWEVANGIHDGWWHCEAAIDVAGLVAGRTADQGTWSINIWRNWKQPWVQAFVFPSADGRHSPPWRFTADPAPSIYLQDRGVRYNGDLDWRLVVNNFTDTAIAANASLRLERDVMPEVTATRALNLAPGASETLVAEVEDRNTTRYHLVADVRTDQYPDGVFTAEATWDFTGPWQWEVYDKPQQPVDLLIAYYPSLNRLRLLADVTNLPADAELATLTAIVREKGGKPLRTVTFDKLVKGRQEIALDLPELDGDYEVALVATGKDVPEGELVRPFERHHFAWEGNSLGLSKTVYPPFAPMTVDGATVTTVLRDHTANGLGLWEQVVATSAQTGVAAPLLAAPMRYVARIDGAEVPVAPARLTLEKLNDQEVRGTGGFTAGPLRADADLWWEYDGALRVDLTLQPTGAARVDELTLEIPFDPKQAKWLHALVESCRNATNVDLKGNEVGTIWTSKGLGSGRLPKNFCTYVYIGSAVRGLCWFADNDNGWSWNHDTPAMELVRRDGGAVVLRIHLVNEPLAIATPRRLRFGLQAAPIKPYLDQGKHRFRFGWDMDTFFFMSTSWGALGNCAGVYPAGRDLLIWEAAGEASRTHTPIPGKRIDEIVQHYREGPWQKAAGVELHDRPWADSMENSIRYFLQYCYRKDGQAFYYNRGESLAEEEFQTYMDEWGTHDWRPDYAAQGKDLCTEIKIVPEQTYRDYAMYWYAKAFDVANNKVVYWDNWMFVASANHAMTDAYVQPDGAVVPAVGVWELRELVKRTFQLMNERGMEPLTFTHMTSTMILPLLSFATIQLDLEWRLYEDIPMQELFPASYMRCVTSGDLVGAWPQLQGKKALWAKETLPWNARNYSAWSLVHDIYYGESYGAPVVNPGSTRAHVILLRPFNELRRDPDCRVYRYWDEVEQPVVSGDPKALIITYAVSGKRAVFAVVSDSPERNLVTPITLRPDLLGFADGAWQLREWEPMMDMDVKDNSFVARIPRYDVRIYEVVPR